MEANPDRVRVAADGIRDDILRQVVGPAVIGELQTLVNHRRRWNTLARVAEGLAQVCLFAALVLSFVSGAFPVPGLAFGAGVANTISMGLLRYAGYAQGEFNKVDQRVSDTLSNYSVPQLPSSHRESVGPVGRSVERKRPPPTTPPYAAHTPTQRLTQPLRHNVAEAPSFDPPGGNQPRLASIITSMMPPDRAPVRRLSTDPYALLGLNQLNQPTTPAAAHDG